MILDAIKSVAGLGDKALSLIPDENQRRRLDHELKVAVMQAERAAVEMQARIVEEHGKSEGIDSRIAAAERRVSEVEADQLAKGVY